MKKIISILIVTISSLSIAQVAIGKSSVSNSSVSLEFGSQNKGILLPWTASAASVTGAIPGTFIFDTTDKKVKLKLLGSWKDLSVDTTGVVDTSLQDSPAESANAQVIIGASTTTAPGILVLESTDKAMILPKVESPHLNIINPSPGMIVYDTATKQLAVFNGTVWSFWKS
ncbi:hypothetical protein [Chryseobacterium lathyri]|uniref:Uncharacterized protein n=1 Tax=Chryseobacterium lathyri TaxID=395933 RepID=A0A511YFT9_9FLAO|nr:hypothetical protein [Chryseobacterium lathyri]GEN74049.1 hypothetical protein CLA01_41210 [Chryseobacterium lathyri]